MDNDDFPKIGNDAPYEVIRDQTEQSGYQGEEVYGGKFRLFVGVPLETCGIPLPVSHLHE